MASAIVTYHSYSAAPRFAFSDDVIPVLPAQEGDRDTLDFTSAADHGEVVAAPMIAVVLADTDCGLGVTDAEVSITLAKTRPIKANAVDYIFVPEGMRLGVIAES
ncbi:hypothetical protein [Novosphingobium sp. KN65.2]|uniref:hypothetical protein n=1 Tax=Novosphingobium sp. KN65.2 TaxID=1478134 RepID=UPI0005DDA953|nr:hypothetical protein [Novosphingobium sp. KN65.2]CDO34029.1 hypothetical protein SPHV1_100063 [Novosphingobium sp. KN65.2]